MNADEIKPGPFLARWERVRTGNRWLECILAFQSCQPETGGRMSLERGKKGTVVSPRDTVTCSGHSFSLIACTRPSGPHVRNNGRRVGVCTRVCVCVCGAATVRAWPRGPNFQSLPSAPCYPRLLISSARCNCGRYATPRRCNAISIYRADGESHRKVPWV